MGCSSSKLDDEEAVQLCKDRKRFIKEAVEERTRFATGHIAYIQSLKRVSAALREYIEKDEPREFFLGSFSTPTFTPIKKGNNGFISISPRSFSPAQIEPKPKPKSSLKVSYLRSGGTPAVSVMERPQSPETVHVQNYSPIHQMGIDGFFPAHPSPSNPSYCSYSPNNRPNFPPQSPQTSHWDSFWNPFSSLDYYGYPARSSIDHMVMDDETRGLRQVREEEGIPDLEEETEHEECDNHSNVNEDRGNRDANFPTDEVLVEDVDDEEEDEETDNSYESEDEVKGLQSHGSQSKEVVHPPQNVGKVEVTNREAAAAKEVPGFTVYVNRKPTSVAEVIKELETQFTNICNSANEVSSLLEVGRAHYSSSNELTAMKMLNPVALFRSGSSRSTSSRFLISSSSSKNDGSESNSDFSDESCVFSNGHQSTMDRLYAWEKKLYEEVRSGERVRIAYEKKCSHLRNQDVKGEDPSSVDRTRAAIRDLYTQIKVSIHSVEAISKRIETLRDEELQPQLVELVQGLSRMWNVMAECHQLQKRTLDEAKILLAGTPSKLEAKKRSYVSMTDPNRLARSASNLENELRNWRACFESWIASQRSYMRALTGWLLRCVRSEPDTSKLAFSPRRSSGTLPIFGLCIQWSRFLDSISEIPVLDGLDFFAAGMGSIYEQQLKDDSRNNLGGSKRFGGGSSEENGGGMDMVEFSPVEEVMTPEKMADVAIRVLCAGMSVAISSLTEFTVASADGYAELVKQWEHAKSLQTSEGSTV
ncbi:hypothetical protein BT93_C1279 [Corymbia citriodora subsp. variegata]|nr:hypothetical protein BT93_C1279 [Corymbia citriodora subsp. variegata]KAF8035193.1 hypothetical protein BT93_C1279 [Corymbia citriodora subsp. variegata]KAF8035194.1 hypothetical protein BT93_C1279 [Corymbia citriodora subsp. variegata]